MSCCIILVNCKRFGIILQIKAGKLTDKPETEFNATDETPSPFKKVRSNITNKGTDTK